MDHSEQAWRDQAIPTPGPERQRRQVADVIDDARRCADFWISVNTVVEAFKDVTDDDQDRSDRTS